MNYATIKYYDIANGPACAPAYSSPAAATAARGCFNAVAWDFHYGQPFDKATRNQVFRILPAGLYCGPFSAGRRALGAGKSAGAASLVRNFKALYPNKTVWCYSGYTWEQLTGKVPLARGAKSPTSCWACWMCWWTANLLKPSTISPCGSGAAATSVCWM